MSREAGPQLAVLQQRILLGGLPGFTLVGLAAWHVLSAQPDAGIDAGAALALAMRWLAVPALCLWAGIQYVAAWRFTHRADNAGSPETASPALDIALRYNRNTLEQGVLAAFAWLALAATWPAHAGAALPVLAALFALGRVAFWIGYRIAPVWRAFGFVLTFLPTVIVLFASVAALLGPA